MKGKPITFTRTGINGEDIEIDDGYEALYDDFDEDYPYDTESRLELLKIITSAAICMRIFPVTENTPLTGLKKGILLLKCEQKLFDVEFSEQAKREISTVGELIDYLIEQGV